MAEKMDEFDRWIEWPEWAKDAIVTDVDVFLSLRDPIRVLWKRRLTVTSKVFTSAEVGRTHSLSRVYIAPWRVPKVWEVQSPTPEAPRG